MEQEQTCGKGLAGHSAIPAKLGALTVAVADILETHMKTLDMTDENSRKEYDAYWGLVEGHRKAAALLESIAGRMAGYRNLPMGRHDPAAMASAKVRETFASYVKLEEELLTLLQARVEQDRKMLNAMSGAGG